MSKNQSDNAICDLLRTLDPGTLFTSITVQGDTIAVRILAAFDEESDRVTFINAAGNLVIADCSLIGSIELRNV